MIDNPPEWLQDWSRQVGAELEDGLREGPSWIAFARENGTVYHTYTVTAPDPFVAPYYSLPARANAEARARRAPRLAQGRVPGLIPRLGRWSAGRLRLDRLVEHEDVAGHVGLQVGVAHHGHDPAVGQRLDGSHQVGLHRYEKLVSQGHHRVFVTGGHEGALLLREHLLKHYDDDVAAEERLRLRRPAAHAVAVDTNDRSCDSGIQLAADRLVGALRDGRGAPSECAAGFCIGLCTNVDKLPRPFYESFGS